MTPMNPEEEIFAAAAALPTEARTAYLDKACAGQPDLRARIEALLRSHEVTGFMEHHAGVLTDPPGESPGQRIGNYKLLEQIGEGGFGVVWVAEQLEPVRRRVALKIIKPGMDSRQVIARFEQERQALAVMDHPNIAKVFDAGATDRGRPYFVMELVRGAKITDYCDRENLPTVERLKLLITVCQAVQHAHQKGIIHRDLKPSNILVAPGDDGEPVPKVIDFGVAKAIQQQSLTDATVYTEFEQMIGTPAYMSPEQAGLGPMDIDTRSDVYSLGVLLYELLTGRPPFDPKELLRAGMDEMRRVIREVEPPRPSTRRTQLAATSIAGHQAAKSQILNAKSKISPDLDWIVMKALEKDRARRYESAAGLVADLRRHMESLPVFARPPGRAYLLSRFIRRHKFGVAAGLAVALSLLAGLGAALWGKSQAESEAAKTKLANEANLRNLHLASMADYASAVKALDEDLEATRKGQRALGFMGKSRWHEGVALLVRALERERSNHQAALKLYNTLRRRQAAKRDWPLHTLKHGEYMHIASFSPDGTRILTASSDKTARLWDATTGQSVGEPMRHEGSLTTARFSPDGSKVLTAGYGAPARLWDAATGRPIGKQMSGYKASFSPDSSQVITISGDAVHGWDAMTCQPFGEPMRSGEDINTVEFSPDGTKIVTAGLDDQRIRIWDVATGKVAGQPMIDDTFSGVDSAVFSPDGLRVVVVHGDYVAYTYPQINSFYETVKPVVAAQIWDVVTGNPVGPNLHEQLDRADGSGLCARFSPDSTMIVTAGYDNTARVWDATSGHAIGQPMRHIGDYNVSLFSATFSPDATQIVSAGDDHTAQLWDAVTGRAIFVPLRHPNRVWTAGFSPDGTKVVTACSDGTARIWELPTNETLAVVSADRSVEYVREDDPRMKPTVADSDAIMAITPSILDWARSFSGLRFGGDGEFYLIPDEERLAIITTIILPEGPWADLAKWINIPSLQRSIDPKLSFTFRQIAELERDNPKSREADYGTVNRLQSALRNDPTVPLARLFLAGALERQDAARNAKDRDQHLPQRAAFLRRYDLDALAREVGKMKNDELAALWVRAANHLAGLPPETKVGIGPRTTTVREEAVKAARKALELVPGLSAAEEVLKQIQGAN